MFALKAVLILAVFLLIIWAVMEFAARVKDRYGYSVFNGINMLILTSTLGYCWMLCFGLIGCIWEHQFATTVGSIVVYLLATVLAIAISCYRNIKNTNVACGIWATILQVVSSLLILFLFLLLLMGLSQRKGRDDGSVRY